jgi:hypothetical protein
VGVVGVESSEFGDAVEGIWNQVLENGDSLILRYWDIGY